MKINANIQEAINRQINMEISSAYAYLAMAAWCEERAFNGFGHWMRLQSAEENEHAMKLFDYLQDREGKVHLMAIPEPSRDYSSPLAVFEASLEQERHVTASIHRIYDLAQQEKDHATVSMLKWFVDEQVEEEKTASEMVDRLKMAGDNPNALLFLDAMAAKRGKD